MVAFWPISTSERNKEVVGIYFKTWEGLQKLKLLPSFTRELLNMYISLSFSLYLALCGKVSFLLSIM
jgi:hypothetical protein